MRTQLRVMQMPRLGAFSRQLAELPPDDQPGTFSVTLFPFSLCLENPVEYTFQG